MTDGDADPELSAGTTADGRTVYVDRSTAERGSDGPFHAVFRSERREARWGYACGNCGSLGVAMGTMGRLVCNDCGNLRTPDQWDAAHE